MRTLKHVSFPPLTISTVLIGLTHLSPLGLKAPGIKVTDLSLCSFWTSALLFLLSGGSQGCLIRIFLM